MSLQVFQTSSEKIESAGLAALTALTSCLSRSVLNSDSEDFLCTFLDLVLKGEVWWNAAYLPKRNDRTFFYWRPAKRSRSL